ncbi:MAG: beta strand repeat-containing protein [Terriglobia bacterium]
MKPSLSKCSFAIIFTLIGLGLFSATGQAQTYVFNQASFGVGNQPEAMAVGDFNGDGKPDFAVANEMDNTVSILLGKPNGTFAAMVNYSVGDSPNSIVAVDLNGDGRLDLAVTNQYGYTVSILLGNGDGTFQPATSFPAGGTSPAAIVAGDFNRDGKMDVALVNLNLGSTPAVAVFLGNGDGTLQAPATYALTSFNGPASLATADLNGDGNLDLVASVGNSTIAVLLGNGDGSFQDAVDYATGAAVTGIAVADFNGDGKLDVATASSWNVTCSVLLGSGDGTFQTPETYSSPAEPWAITAVDVNGDGKVDLVVAGNNSFGVLLGNGNGTFQTEADYSGGGGLSSMAVADFTGDGKLDLAGTVSGPTGRVVVLVNRGDGSFFSSATTPFGTVAEPDVAPTAPLTFGDFRGIGRKDLATVNQTQNTVAVLLNTGNGSFQPHVDYAVGSEPVAVVTADLNRDGNLDLIVLNGNNNITGSVSILLGNGDGTFRSHVDYPASGWATSVAVGDFNGDGVPDLAVTNVTLGTVSILLGNGDGTFRTKVDYHSGANAQMVAVGDFNGDGKLDLAVTNYPGSTVSVLLGNGDGTFQAPVSYVAGELANNVTAADFNGDGKLDLAVTTYSGVGVLLGNGDGTFQTAFVGCSGTGNSLVATDINGDGKLDLLMANGVGEAVVCTSNGDGTFSYNMYGTGNGTVSSFGAVGADFNGDGSIDLALANSFQGTVTLFFNDPLISLYPSKLVFANEGQGTTSPVQPITTSNPSSGPLAISSIAASSPFAQTNTCGATLAVGANCTVSVTFAPTGTGDETGAVTLFDSVPGSPQSITLSGLAINGPAAALSPATLTFGAFPAGTTSPAITATLQNTGNAVLTGISIAISGDFLESSTCSTSLAVGASCSIAVKFMPTARGMREGSLAVSSSAIGSPNAVSLEGVGLAPVMTFSTASLNFGDQLVGITSGAQTVILTSAGDLNLNITGISTSGDFAQTNNCSLPLAPGSSCTVSVTMTPTEVGTRMGSLTFTDNEPAAPPPVGLTGNASYAVPAIVTPLSPATAAPGSLAFTLAVNGSGFAPASLVQWKGSQLPTTYVSPTQLTAAVPASDVAAAGTAVVTVVNPAPGGGTSDGAAFEITTGTPTVAFIQSTYPVGQYPEGVAEADLNGDLKPDMVIANFNSGTVSVLLGNGDGTFQAHVDYPTGEGPESVIVADFNHDGKPDLAVVNTGCPLNGICGAASISILLGNGDGTFQSPLSLTSGNGFNSYFLSGSLVAGDFNGDGKLDMAVGEYGISAGTVQIFLGNGDGTFQTGGTYQVGSIYSQPPTSIVVGDFNADGKLDLAAASGYGSSSISILLGNGDGTFQSAMQYPTGPSPYTLVTGDFNGDGILDLATANDGIDANSVSVLLGNGNGTFQTNVDYATGTSPVALVVADINGDGKLDLAVSNYNTNNVSVLLGSGDGTFGEHQDFPTGVGPDGLEAADFNGDGRMDLAVADSLDNNVSVLLQIPTGPQPAASVSTTSLTFPAQEVGTTSSAQSVVLSNSGASALIIASVVATGDFAQSNNCGASVAAGGNCTINVTFRPAAAGARSGSLIITDNSNGLTGREQAMALSGTGLAPIASLSATSLTFSGQNVGSTSSAQGVTLKNTGSAALAITSIQASGDFAQTHNCGSSVAAGASCTINVTFTPTQGGDRSGAITVTDNAAGSPHAVALAGTGEDFTLGVPSGGSSTASVTPGGSTRYPLSFGGLGGLNQTVKFTCTGAPSEATCALNPTSATPGGSGSVSVTVTVTTTAPSAAPPYGRRAPPKGLGRELQLVSLLLLALLTTVVWGLAGGRRFRSSLRWVVAMGAVAAIALAMAACGGGGGGTVPTNPGTPAGTYTLTVTGTAGSGSTALQHSTTLTLTVT